VLVFVAAERRELDGLLRHLQDAAKLDWPLDFARRGTLNGREVALVANGPGPKLAGAAVDMVLEKLKVEALISTGFCGALNHVLEACDIFAATEVIGAGPALAPETKRSFKKGKLLSLDRVIGSSSKKAELATRADAVEMEAAAVTERAARFKIPFYAVRVITDTAQENLPLDFNRTRSADGHFSRSKIIAAALRRPLSMVPELMKLNSRTKRAALALGDFLADARF
jgi:adenosylhomocysteine nucleosidase